MPLRPLVFFLPLSLLAQDDAASLLRRVSDNYRNLKSFHFESESEARMTYEGGLSLSRERTVLAVAPDNRVRFEMSQPPSTMYGVVADGATLWRIQGVWREYSRVPQAGPPLETKGGGPEAATALRMLKLSLELHWNLHENLRTATIAGEEPVEIEGRRTACTVVRAVYSPPPGMEGVDTIQRTYWIDPRSLLILRSERVTTGNLFPSSPYLAVESRYTTRYTRAAIDPDFDAALFTYTPPESFREVDTLEGWAAHRATKDMTGRPAPALAGTTLEGAPWTLDSLRGQIVLLDFWATWCLPCREQLPLIARLHRELQSQGLVVVGVNDDPGPDQARKYLQEHQHGWTNVYDGKTHAAREAFRVRGLPTLVLIDREGRVVEYQSGNGPQVEPALRARLRELGLKLP